MKVLVLGGAGFMGSHVARALARAGHTVRIFDRPRADRGNLVEIFDAVEIVEGDLINEADLLRGMEGVEVVIHMICTTLPQSSNENPVYDVQTNLAGTLKLLDVARMSGVRKVIFPSSGGTVYGITGAEPVEESHPTNPLCSYGITKLAVEKYLHLYRHLHGLDFTILRISNPYGPRQNRNAIQGAVGVFLPRVVRQQPITIWGDGSIARDFIFIDDVVEAFVRASTADSAAQVLNIGSGKAVTLLDLIATMAKVAGKLPKIEFLPSRRFDVPVNCLNISKAARELDWAPHIDLEDGIARTYAWLKSLG